MRCSTVHGRWRCKRDAVHQRKRCELCIVRGRVRHRQYMTAHPEKNAAYNKKYRAKHYEEIKIRDYLRRNRKKVTDHLKYLRNREGVLAYNRKWKKKNPEKFQAQMQRHNVRRSNAGQDAYLQSWLKGETIVRKLDFAV